MLNDYKDKQSLAYNLFVNDINHNCVTHAYLIDENNYLDAYNMVLSFVKAILCDNKYLDNNNCLGCTLCKRIDDGNYPELKIIEPDGMYIKKQQIIDLQQVFSRSSVEGSKRIYIIKDCEKMRPEAANSMLKFLEEPEEGIIAILMTNNINNVLSTIISRCKVVKLNNISDSVIDNSNEELDNLAIKFVSNLENRGIDLIIDVKELWFSVIGAKDRDKMVLVFDKMIDIYFDMIKIKNGNNNIKCIKWIDEINSISFRNSLEDILNKINILVEYKDSIKFNVNSNLLMDSLIISIGGVNNGSRY
jgi:DNA polymerase-3 subunit delta'